MKILLALLFLASGVCYAQDVIEVSPNNLSGASPTHKYYEVLKKYIHIKTQFVKTGETYLRKRTEPRGYFNVFVYNDSSVPIKNVFIEFDKDASYVNGYVSTDAWIMPKTTGSGRMGENVSSYIATYNIRSFQIDSKDAKKISKLK